MRSTKINGKTCAVCDEEKPSVPLPGEDKLFRKLLPSELPSRAYIVLQLSPRGIVTDGAANAQEEHAARSNGLNVCTSCFTSLKVAQNAPLAIANGFVIKIVL